MLKTVYATAEEIPAGYEALYTERNGQWELTGVIGVKTQADIDRVQGALVKERNDHKALKAAFAPFEGLDPEVVATQANELEEARAQLEAVKADGSIDEAKLEPIISARVKQAVAPIEREKVSLTRQIDALKTNLTTAQSESVQLRGTITSGSIERAIRDAAIEAKVLSSAVVDAVMHGKSIFEVTDDRRIITKDNEGVTPGLTPKEWLNDQKEKSPHWWPATVGGGSQGNPGGPKGTYGGANNPWSKAGWNVTKQGALVRSLGEQKASEIAAQAGSKLGATHATEA